MGSATPYLHKSPGKEPSFAVLYVDPETMLPVDYETWNFDLEYANKFDIPKWRRLLNWRDTYGLKDLSPSSMLKLAESFKQKEREAIKFLNNSIMSK